MIGIPGNSGWLSSLRSLGVHQQTQATAIERLTTGKKINRASDDPSGMVATSGFKVRQVEITKKIEAFEFENARLGATEGGLSVLQDLVLELQGIAVAAANTGAQGQDEATLLAARSEGVLEAINHIAQTTMFNGDQILIGYTTDKLGGVISDGERHGMAGFASLLVNDPEAAQKLADGAVDSIAGDRAAIGLRLKRNDSQMNTLREEFEANAGVLGQIEDTDYAKEASELVRSQILEQATIKSILIERENAERVLDLLAPPANGPVYDGPSTGGSGRGGRR